MDASFYAVLGVDADAEAATIRAAYREAVKEHHPDVSDDPGSVERFKRLTSARDVLLDPDERARYDRLGHDTYVARHLDGPTPGSSEDARDTRGARAERDARETRDARERSARETNDPTERERTGTRGARTGARAHWRSDRTGESRTSGGGVADPTPGDRRHRAQEGRRRHVRAGPDEGRGPTADPTGDPTVEEPWQTASTAYQRSAAASQAAAERTDGVSIAGVLSRVGPWIFVYAVLVAGAAATAAFALLEAGSTVTIAASLFAVVLLGSAIGLSTLHVASRVAGRDDG